MPVLALVLASCGEKANPAKADAVVSAPAAIDPKAVQAVTDGAHADLNSVPASVQQLLVALRDAGAARSSQLSITVDGAPTLIDAWLWNRGFLELRGVSDGEAVFDLTAAGLALIDKPLPWFWLKSSSPPTGDCQSGAKIADLACTVTAHYEIVSSASGKAAFGTQTLPGFDVTNSASTSAQGWQVSEYGVGLAPHLIALNAILGPESDREAVRTAYIQAVTVKAQTLQQTATDAAAAASRAAGDAPKKSVDSLLY